MKLCPQCAFIYEDDQKVCDMDGKALINAPAPAEPKASVPSRMTIDLSPVSRAGQARTSSRRLPLLILLIVILATLLSVVVFAQVRRSRSIRVESPAPARSSAPSSKLQPSAADRVSSSSVEVTALVESPDAPSEAAPETEASPASPKAARLATSPVSAGVPGSNSRAFLLRLTNGATIKADEVWERKEGIWYRQAGMVTFLKRRQVRTIERVAPAAPQPKTAANADEGIRKSDKRTPQNQLRIRQLETVETKKPSRVKSFLRLTGRILKKPFKG